MARLGNTLGLGEPAGSDGDAECETDGEPEGDVDGDVEGDVDPSVEGETDGDGDGGGVPAQVWLRLKKGTGALVTAVAEISS